MSDKCRDGGGGGVGMGMFQIDRAIKNKDVWFSFHVLMQKVFFFQKAMEDWPCLLWHMAYMLQVKVKFRLKFFNLCLFFLFPLSPNP